MKFYNENVRRHDKRDMVGVFRQVQLMAAKGVTLAQIAQAMRTYARDPWTKTQPEYKRHHIRRFLMPERIRQYAAPAADPAMNRMAAMNEQLLDGDAPPPPLIPIATVAVEAPEPEPDRL